ncbi:MAG: radical SAM protein [Gemmatimonadota bacterium]
MNEINQMDQTSPEYAKLSRASAIALGLMRGRMYRGAVNRCVNLLVHYPEGCTANCAYCGLARQRPGKYLEKSFIHVDWPLYPMERIIEAINGAPGYVQRTCISMITNGKCRQHTVEMARRLTAESRLPVSVLLSPTIIDRRDLTALRESGVDKVGIAIDLATPELFERQRGSGVSGPHRWDRYWEILQESLDIFGRVHVGAHLMVGMGESEQDMAALMDRLWQLGAVSHLFSFFPEEGSRLSGRPQPPWPAYLAVQLARYLIEENLSPYARMGFDSRGRIIDFGLDAERLSEVIARGTPFMTTGCLGRDGRVACNRPFGNCLPEARQWNYPYPPNDEELGLIRHELPRLVCSPKTF